jgi:hypothetical protein
MKLTIAKHCLAVVLVLSVCSCEEGFLDQVPDDRLTEPDVFINKNNTEMFLANIYANVPDEMAQRFVTTGNGHGNSGPWTGASDEAEYAPWSTTPNEINTGNWNASSDWVETFWSRYYQGIRNATYFMANVDKCVPCREPLVKQYKAEARALRALYYYYLLRMFGPVILLGDEVVPPDAGLEDVVLPRASFDEGVEYVVSEMEAAAESLPNAPAGSTAYGRMTRSIMLAMRQEVLLMAASPLFNGNADYVDMKNADGKQLISQEYSPAKWQRAAEAAKAYISEFVPQYHDLYRKNDAGGNFSAFLSCRDVMLDSWNTEWIFGRPGSDVTTRQYDMTPYHAGALDVSRGGGGLGVTQKMVDAYFMANGASPIQGYNPDGTPIVNPASGYLLSGSSSFRAPDDTQARTIYNQWVNREPRFYVGITYDGRLWINPNTPGLITLTRKTGNSGSSQSQWDFSPTGYIARKNMIVGDRGVGGRALVLYRLANVYLNYAEALNEYDPGNPEILNYLNKIRERAGIPGYGDEPEVPIPASQEEMREAIHKERRVEFAFESVRWFDTRRWKIAEETDDGAQYGLDINSDPPNFYNVVRFETRVFEKKHYLFPIPLDETLINNLLVQNTGWSAN